MAVDLNPGSPFFGRLYVGAVHDDFVNQDLAITVSVSADGGATWTTSGKLIDGGLNDEPHFAFGVDGTVFVSYAACYLWSGSSCRHRVDLELQRSIDGGSTWSGERRISSIRVRAGSTTYERLRRGNGPSVSLSPSIAIDDSTGPHAGRLYAAQMVWRMYRLRMELRYSNDRGDSWSDPVEVAPRPMHDQFLGSVAVSATGVLGITWLEQRHDRNDATYRTYQTVSTDGGVTFAGLAPVATTGSDPYLWGWSINEAASVWSGDRLVSAWPDTRTGALQIEFGWIS
jgi:hypothetical protein